MLGAFGAHGLKSRLPENLLNAWQTGVEYQMYHALALLVVGIMISLHPSHSLLKYAGGLFVAGTLLFSGSLYALALTEQRWLGPITPLGGLLFIAGWVVLAIAVARMS